MQPGPFFIGARLVPLHNDGDSSPRIFAMAFGDIFPNDGLAIYANDPATAPPLDELYRLRVHYTGGMTPDGLTGLTPDMFERYFVLLFSTGQELSSANETMTIEGTGTTVTVLGLAECGKYQAEGYTPCYADDRDNYIDIIMQVTGDANVLNSALTSFRAFSEQPGLYNPGGPGPFPFETVRYVAPALEQTFPIDVDLDRVREVTYCVNNDGSESTSITTCTEWFQANQLMKIEQGQIFPEQLPSIVGVLRTMLSGMDEETGKSGSQDDRCDWLSITMLLTFHVVAVIML